MPRARTWPAERQAIVAALRRLEPKLRRALVAAFLEAMGQSTREVAALLALVGGPSPALAGQAILQLLDRLPDVLRVPTMIGRVRVQVIPLLEDALRRAIIAGGAAFAADRALAALARPNPRQVAEIARQHVGHLVTGITRTQRATIAAVLEQGFAASLSPQQIARELTRTLGMTAPQARALAAYRAQLVARGVRGATLTARLDARARRFVKLRARVVARTEAVRAATLAQRDVWRRALDRLPPGVYHRQWLRGGLQAPCPVCDRLDLTTATLTGFYPHPDVFGQRADGPPAHPNCDCGEQLILVATLKAVPRPRRVPLVAVGAA